MSRTRNFFIIILLFAAAFFVFEKVYASYPWNVIYPYGIQTTDANATANALTAYTTWKNNCITTNGAQGYQRVQSPEHNPANETVSEGMGYGMIMAVYFSDQALLNNLWQYKQYYNDSYALMHWEISPTGTVLGSGSATDADEDIAFALVMADREWGSAGAYNYNSLASAEITKIKTYDCTVTGYLNAGDSWGSNYTEYPSYYMPAWYTEFGIVNPGEATFWVTVEANCNANLATGRNSSNGLVAETLNQNGTVNGSDTYSYNSCRVPWRYAIDYVWNGDSAAQTETSEMALFWHGIGGPYNIKDGYNVATGAATGQYNNAAFVGPAACSFMESSTYQTDLNTFYSADYSFGFGNYYNGALEVMTMLLMSGNFPKYFFTPTNTPIVSPTPTFTQSPVVSPTPSYTITPTYTITPLPTPYNPQKGIMIYPNPINYNANQWMNLKFYLPQDESTVWIRIYTFAFRLIYEDYLPNGMNNNTYNFSKGWNSVKLYVPQYLYNAANGIYYYAIYDNSTGNLKQISPTDAFVLLR